MSRRLLAIGLTITAILAPGITGAQDSAPRNAAYTLRPEWNIETARSGRAHVVGYLYNTSATMDAVNVLLALENAKIKSHYKSSLFMVFPVILINSLSER